MLSDNGAGLVTVIFLAVIGTCMTVRRAMSRKTRRGQRQSRLWIGSKLLFPGRRPGARSMGVLYACRSGPDVTASTSQSVPTPALDTGVGTCQQNLLALGPKCAWS